MNTHLKSPHVSQGFTLLELLVVLTLAAGLMALASMGYNQVSRASSLASTAQQAGDMIILARQTAVARNLPVEVRFFKLPEFDSSTGDASMWRAMHIVIPNGEREESVAPPLYFERHVFISEKPAVSPLLAHLGEEQLPSQPFGGYPLSQVRFKSFMIRPDSTVSTLEEVPSNSWFLTLHQDGEPLEEQDLPANFATLQINPVTARVAILQP